MKQSESYEIIFRVFVPFYSSSCRRGSYEVQSSYHSPFRPESGGEAAGADPANDSAGLRPLSPSRIPMTTEARMFGFRITGLEATYLGTYSNI